MNILEKGYWNSSPVKNYGSIFYLNPKGNSTLFEGSFIKEFGLKHFIVDGKVVETPHDESLRAFFDHEPGHVHAVFENFICPFIKLEMDITATGKDCFLLKYTLHNRAFENKDVKIVLGLMANQQVEKIDITNCSAHFIFDLNHKKKKHGDGTIDFSSLRGWFIENEKLDLHLGFTDEKIEIVKEFISRGSETKVLAEGIEMKKELTVKAGQCEFFEMTLCFGEQVTQKQNCVMQIWKEFVKPIPHPKFNNAQEKLAYYKSWYILFFNEVKRNGYHWCLTGLGFPSMWVWDTSPFISDAYINLNPEFVQSLISVQLESLKETGMMPLHVIMGLKDKTERKDEITQIPLVAHTAWKVFEKTRDMSFAGKAYKSLQLNYNWFEIRRKPNNDIPLWGIDDKRAPYHYGPESGMDNCPIYKDGPVYSVAINSAKYSFEAALANFADSLELHDESRIWLKKSKTTLTFMLNNMWDNTDHYYYPLTYDMKKARIKTSDLYPGLYLGIFPVEKVWLIAEVFRREFLTEYGLTTVSMKDENFNPSLYALGSVWPFMNYMIYKGLIQAQCFDLAEQVFTGTIRMLNQFPGVFECYNPVERTLGRLKDGPLCIPHMSFCAAGVVSMCLLRDKISNFDNVKANIKSFSANKIKNLHHDLKKMIDS
ncbi:MAG: hypothetical protein A2Y10_17515 [Planctomycetes bacterium GWF2_41_51]|nr:MAG: hypothetical protein A2Y10_17515 [Planctomycetes bacterium GWF2_41_51]HBG28025.1 hypothetical protein [Phycisphaerales bacterium]